MYNIFRQKKLIVLFLFFIVATAAKAQDPRWTNLPTYEKRIMHYGFTIGVGTSGYRAKLSQSFLDNDTIVYVRPKFSTAFTLGFVVNLHLHEHLDLRLLPTVGFYERQVEYQFNNTNKTQSIESTFIELPLMLKYKSQRRKNARMYLIGGVKYSIEAGSKKKEKKQTELRTQSSDFAIEYGVGFDLYRPLFKFSPELRLSHGIVNMLNQDPNVYSTSLTKLTTHTLTLYLNFE